LPDIGFQWPDPYFGVPEAERSERVHGTVDVCAIDDEDFFIRGVLLIPVLDQSESFGLGIWVSQSQQSYDTYLENFDSDEIGPSFGWFSNKLPFYGESTWALKTKVHFQGAGQRPRIELESCDHPLYRDICDGISLEKAWRFVHWNDGEGDA
jgi:hypothetical protein